MTPLVAIPVKPFDAAKRRLATRLPADLRRAVSTAMARRTVEAVEGAGAEALVLAADAEVAEWAASHEFRARLDHGSSLDEAAASAVALAAAEARPWAIIHADLPLVTPGDVTVVVESLDRRVPVIAPSSDGGTSVLGGLDPHPGFSYGRGSFSRHLRSIGGTDHRVIVRRAFLLDLDEPADLDAALSHPAGRWLTDLVMVTS